MLYEYSKTQLPRLSQIHADVIASAMTDKSMEWCNWEEDEQKLKVNFTNTLIAEDKTILDGIVTACPGETNDIPGELSIKNGDKHIGFKSPEVLTEDTIYVLPEDGTDGQAMVTDGNKNLSFETIGGSPTKSIVTVGISGADYDNFDDAIDYLRTLNGGTIIVTSNMTITSTTIKDLTNITIEGDLFFAGMRQINKTAVSGYWYGKNVVFKDIVLFRMSDAGANEIFRFTEDYQDVTLKQVTYVGLSSFNSPVAFNCNGKEAHIVCDYVCGLGTEDWGAMAFSNTETLVLQLRNRVSVYLTGEIDACWYDSSCIIEGNPTWNTPDHPIMIDKTSAMENDSSVTGSTVKDALNNLSEKNGINGTFTTVDGKTVTVVDGQITSIV